MFIYWNTTILFGFIKWFKAHLHIGENIINLKNLISNSSYILLIPIILVISRKYSYYPIITKILF